MDRDEPIRGEWRTWFSREWNRLREVYGVADRKPSPPAQAPKPPEALEKTLAELDELAAAMGYRSVSTLCSWLNGTTAPTPEAWKKARAAILELAEVGKC